MKMLEEYYDLITNRSPLRVDIQPVDVTEAARWFLEVSPQEKWNLVDDFPVVTPPFPIMWMEYNPPSALNRKGNMVAKPEDHEYMGCLSFMFDVEKGMERAAIEQDFLSNCAEHVGAELDIPMHFDDAQQKKLDQAALDAGREASWIVIWTVYTSTKKGLLYRGESFAAYLDSSGQIIPENAVSFANPALLEELYKNGSAGESLMPFFFATSLMHAKNVTCEDVGVPEAIKRRRAKERKPCLKFKVLQINPIRRQANQEDMSAGGAKRAMHIVRAHFKDYRNSGGLFGKHKGLYWWDMHVAGDIANGRVIKDYAIAETMGQPNN